MNVVLQLIVIIYKIISHYPKKEVDVLIKEHFFSMMIYLTAKTHFPNSSISFVILSSSPAMDDGLLL